MDSGPDLPTEPLQIIPWKNTLIVLNESGLYRFNPTGAAQAAERKPIADMVGRFFGNNAANTTIPGEAFVEMAPKDWKLSKPMDISASPSFNHILTYSQGKVGRWKAQDDTLEQETELSLDIPSETVAAIGTNDKFCVVCPNGMKPFLIDVETMTVRRNLDEMGEVTTVELPGFTPADRPKLRACGSIWRRSVRWLIAMEIW